VKRTRGKVKRTRGKDLVSQIVETSQSPADNSEDNFKKGLISSGSVMLNLACTDRYDVGYGLGKMVNDVGDSSSGKSLKELTLLALLSNISAYDEYELIYDDVEAANEFDIKTLFGKKAQERITPPGYDEEGEPKYSDTIQEFTANILDRIDAGTPFVWILDSFDALTSKEEKKKIKETIAADRKKNKNKDDKEPKGSYGVEKAKIIGQTLRMIIRKLKKTKSLLIIVSQTRDNINPNSFAKKTRSGGNALRFYASHEPWFAVVEKIKRKKRIVGVTIKAKVQKNKYTGKLREVEFPIYYDYGVDDIEACINFLVYEKFWTKSKAGVIKTDMGTTGMLRSVVRHIEKNGLEVKLFKRTEKAWKEIEQSLKVARKPKFC
jgi:hypothetical protein